MEKAKIKVAVHDGDFHADDVFAIAALQRIFAVEVIRARDPKVLASCDMRVDVGGVYDHKQQTYDHHQVGGAGTHSDGVPYAGFGLIWKHFGEKICGDTDVAKYVEQRLVEPIDANDNGFPLWRDRCIPDVFPCSLDDIVKLFNPTWIEESGGIDVAFAQAVVLAGTILERQILFARSIAVAREKVERAIVEAKDKRIIIFDEPGPWTELVTDMSSIAIFIVYLSPSGNWRVRCVPPVVGSFAKRLAFPEAWAGRTDGELAKLTGVADATFCHKDRFLACASSKKGAIAIAKKALKRSTGALSW